MSDVLNVQHGHPPIKWLGPGKAGDTDYALQEGVIYNWSESNCRYERAWWLDRNGRPKQMHSLAAQNHVEQLILDRPFDPRWLAQ